MAETDKLEQPPTPQYDSNAPEQVTEHVKSAISTDPKIDAAVDDIMKQDGEEALQLRDEAAENVVVMKTGRWEQFKNFLAEQWDNPRKRYGAIAIIVTIVGVALLIPLTRYTILGLVLKAPATVQVVDSKTGSPVSGAVVTLDGKTIQTEANGEATLRVHAGSKQLRVSKKYYQDYAHGELVALSGSHNMFRASVVALGRQVKVKVINKISAKPIAGVSIGAQGTSAKTDTSGVATVIVPSTKVSLTAAGDTAHNTFSLTPIGKLYFLSNLNGNIDVIKTNLDGSERQTVLAGTGSEDRFSTSLLASRDWKYLALLSKRAGGDSPSIYLIDTTNGDKLTTIDQGAVDFSLVGWSGSRFVYQVTRSSLPVWQSNRQAFKSFDATTGQTLLLDQSQAAGSDGNNYLQQSFGSPYIINDQLIYTKGWNASFNNWSQIPNKQAELDTIGVDGSGHKVVKAFSVDAGPNTSNVFISTSLYQPNSLYIYFLNGSSSSFYDYEDGKVTTDTTLTSDKFYSTPYPTYLESPAGTQTFWADQRDGKNTLSVGDQNAKNPKQVATLSEYNTYGWYTDDYLLVSKSSSELYILSSTGGTPIKITDYYKPAISYNGYGGGYGGL
jgi:hypothetical protein